MKNFALIGAAGYIAPRHMEAIHVTGNKLVAAVDPSDSVGIIDRYFPESAFFTEIERFDRHLEKLRHKDESKRVEYVSICSPNYLHDAHIRLALRVKAHAICEKPLALTPWNLDALRSVEEENGCKVYNILQLRVHDDIVKLKKKLQTDPPKEKAEVQLSYVTRRGAWYHYSWKGDHEKSGGPVMNIGIHFFDMLMWLFGAADSSKLHLMRPDKASGTIELEHARVKWFLSVDGNDLPEDYIKSGKTAFRSITINGEELEFSGGFTDLHNRVYQDILDGKGYGIEDARSAIEFVHKLKSAEVEGRLEDAHPFLKGK
jgi:UDP-N-acetyl-2-amino-2-deoxyglucuronate dehydrogenase